MSLDKFDGVKGFDMCPICGSWVSFWGKTQGHQILVCSSCGLGMTEDGQKQELGYHRDAVYQKESAQFANIFQRRIKLVNKFYPQPGKVLEIGSSTGLLLSLLKKQGWEVLGVELSKEAASEAEKRGVPTLKVPFEEAKLPLSSFDVVIINHTLEHLQDLDLTIKKVSALLKNKGILLIDVPNFGSFSAGWLKGNWPYLLPKEHFWHFTARSLTLLLEKYGLNVLAHYCPSGIFDYGNPGLEVWQSLKGFKKRFFRNILTFIPSLLVTVINRGTSLTVVAQKIK